MPFPAGKVRRGNLEREVTWNASPQTRTDSVRETLWDPIERFHLTSQSRENHTGGHFGVQLKWRLSMRQVAHAKCSPNLTADGLTFQVCSISLPGTCYM